VLDLDDAGLTDVAGKALLASSTLAGVRELRVTENRMSAAIKKQLAATFGDRLA
jgi:hypothetical protein